VQEFLDEKFESAKSALEEELASQSGDEALATQSWIIYCDAKHSRKNVTTELSQFAAKHQESAKCQIVAASILRIEGHVHHASKLLDEARSKWKNNTDIAIAQSLCLMANSDDEGAISILENASPDDSPEVAVALAEVFEKADKRDEALKAIQGCYAKNPSNREVRFKYARLAQDLNHHDVAAYLLNELTSDKPDNSEYWGYLGNTCLQLDLPDVALMAYRTAEKSAGPGASSEWIVSNIGNLFSARGLHGEASIYLERGLELHPKSDYAHDRLASALKKSAAERTAFDKVCSDGKKAVRANAAQLLGALAPSSEISPLVDAAAVAKLVASIANLGKPS
jgi:predicted Zn-dependent protease